MEHDRISRQQRRAIGFGPARLGPPPSSTFEVHSTAHVENIAADNNINDDSGTATKHDSKMHPPDKGKGKRVAPISSGAFSFSLGAGPSKKPKGDEGNNNKAAASEHVGASKPRSPVVSKTLRQPSKTHAQTAVTTPRRPERPLDSSTAKPSPRLQAMPPPMSLTLTPKLQKTDVTQTTPTSARRAPPTFSLAEASPKGLGSPQIARTRPLNPVSGSPFRLSGITAQKAPKPDVTAASTSVAHRRNRWGGVSAKAEERTQVRRRMQDAPVLLQVTRTMRAPSPSAALAHCRVLRWAAGTGAHAADEDVMVVFKSLPQECPRIGRALERIDENTRAAVWFPTSELELRAQRGPDSGTSDGRERDGQERQDAPDGQDATVCVVAHESSESDKHPQEPQDGQGHAPDIRRADRADRADRPLPVLFASRYLLAGA
ncbi:hypothetical protein A1Q1_04301 [Trichosporon asahii var. asahii CBS 2479]|uniref:Uncharacterized protein n=1 Tax=Trichosporon asahii var. asahii (strain ATCC 90039 / CBS 2479 / JCM 2466 / KCTC 7840 / NBRC 103889/ NCYC 2677 / UAMH 7654) TaxID=1186058 RepID=J5QFC6_TRIAS|nr:hypothetical protein A1Q1_04301 [Trichosporon asahii var. asahii CBS 2479]EJT47058.1 hypothetical protein A1Q1_04301 [Trichosporon asahii var. asahii CBS 2479]